MFVCLFTVCSCVCIQFLSKTFPVRVLSINEFICLAVDTKLSAVFLTGGVEGWGQDSGGFLIPTCSLLIVLLRWHERLLNPLYTDCTTI